MQVSIVDLTHVMGVQKNLCYGIARTNQMADEKARSYHSDDPLYVYFHLPAGTSPEQRDQTQQTLKRRYLPMAPDVFLVDRIEDVPDGAPLIMGTRGASPQTREQAKQRLNTILDTTCPYVSSQEAAARKLLEEGYQIAFCGRPDYHGLPRLQGIAKLFNSQIAVTHRPGDVGELPFKRSTRIGVILQTTWHISLAKEVIAEMVSRFREVRVIDTSCIDSLGRVPAARKIAEESDVVVLMDIGNVARYLEEEIEELTRRSDASATARVYRIERKDQLRSEWFRDVKKVSIIGGINVHMDVLEAVAARIRELESLQPAV